MPLTPGTRFGVYEVVAPIGAGGMGEVYRALDTRLGRDVALKVLPHAFANDRERLQRFEREAKTLALLNHPHIASVYGFEIADGAPAIAMELVDGQTVGERIASGALPLTETLRIARQIAEALDAAHERGIVHRDLKPANVKITSQGTVKVLDFGLAKTPDELAPDLSRSPTLTALHTREGVILGTAAYMSPEQARGQSIDKRSDVWAFGCMLFEMLTRRVAFGRATVSDTIVAILERDPDWNLLPSTTPPALRRLIGRCLEKDPRRRLRDVGDALSEIEEAARQGSEGWPSNDKAGPSRPPSWRRRSVGALGAVVAAAILAGLSWVLRGQDDRQDGVSVLNMMPLTTDPGYEGEPSFSPDGGTVAYVTDREGNFEIVRRQISGGVEVNLTNDPADDVQPTFSPDGQTLAFVSSRGRPTRLRHEGYDLPLMGGSIWVMAALGGAARRVVEDGGFPSWSPDGASLVYAAGPGFASKLFVSPAIGGAAREIALNFTSSRPRFLLYPRYSADARWIVFEGDSPAGFGPRDIYVVASDGGAPQAIATGQQPVWSAGSRSVIFSNGARGANYSLWEVPISNDTGVASGPARPITLSRGRDAQPAVSRDGRYVAFAGVAFSFNAEAMPFDAESGRASGPPTQLTHGLSVTYFQSFSPDGRSIAYESRLGTTTHLWRTDRAGAAMQLTADPAFDDSFPRWNPKGGNIAFSRRQAGIPASGEIWLMAEDGGSPRRLVDKAGFFAWLGSGRGLVYFSRADNQLYLLTIADGTTRRLTNEPGLVQVMACSADDQWLVYSSAASGNSDLRALPLGGGEPRTVAARPENENHAFISPSGQWLDYQRNHENFYRVPGPAQGFRPREPEQVTHFPETGLLLDDPQWSVDGRQLLYSHGRMTSDIWLAALKQ